MNGIPDPGRASRAVELVVDGAANPFEDIKHTTPDGRAFWNARELCTITEYETWRNFAAAVERAKVAITNTGEAVSSHVVDVSKVVDRPQGGSIVREDYELSRHGAYMVLMNGDPRKPAIAAAQAYFAIRTHQAEVIEQQLSIEDRTVKRLAVLQAAKGLIDPKHLEAKARCQLAIGLGEAPEIEQSARPLYAQTYLEAKGLSRKQIKAIGGVFGKRLKAAYQAEHGAAPMQYPLETTAGQIRDVNAYTETDRPLFDAVWNRYYAAGMEA